MPRIAPDRVELRADTRRDIPDLLPLLGDGPAYTSGGVGGWESVSRPGRRPLTVWRGIEEPLRMHLPILFDRYSDGDEGHSVEAEVRALEKMGGLDKGDPEPPLLDVEGALPHDESRTDGRNRWVIESIEWGDAIRRESDGHRVRQAAVVVLLEHVEDDRLKRLVRAPGPSQARYMRARQGDTFAKIAARELGSARFGTRLARLNNRRSPDVHLDKGKRVRLPSVKAEREWKRGG